MKKVILMFVALAVVCGCGAGKKSDVAKTLIGDWEIVEAGGLATEGGFEKATIPSMKKKFMETPASTISSETTLSKVMRSNSVSSA